ncbi:hypothetical protein ACSAZK_11700 [Methanosarcina sp. Mfa9]|uniref:hypothetical protein n=1 Tax=Methanosarcina sp. Mfa9 TaxID=3439063 RepID=UPI003F8599D4
MLIKYRKFGILSVSLMILLACAVVGLAADPEGPEETESLPELPLILKGDLDVNGEPVEAGSEIEAYYEGKLIAKSTVENEGEYVLNLNLATDDYENLGEVEYYIDGNAADLEIPESEAAAIANEDVPGSIVEMDVQGSVSQPSGSSGGSDGSSDGDNEGGAVVITNDNISGSPVEEPEEEPESEENVDNGQEAGDEAETKASSESADAETTPIWGALAPVALLGAVLIIRKMRAK